MGLFSRNVSAKQVVDRMVRGGVVSSRTNLALIQDASGKKHPNEVFLTLLAVDRLGWEVALSRVGGRATGKIRVAMSEHYGEMLLRELEEGLKAVPHATQEEKKLLASSLERQVRGRTASLGKEWNAHRHDRPGPEYWACKRAVQMMGLDESNPAYVARLSASLAPTLAGKKEYLQEVARHVKAV
jgi:hypothetical protein